METDGGGGRNYVNPNTGMDTGEALDQLKNGFKMGLLKSIFDQIPSGYGIEFGPNINHGLFVGNEEYASMEVVYLWASDEVVFVGNYGFGEGIYGMGLTAEFEVSVNAQYHVFNWEDLEGVNIYSTANFQLDVFGEIGVSIGSDYSLADNPFPLHTENSSLTPAYSDFGGIMRSDSVGLSVGVDIMPNGADGNYMCGVEISSVIMVIPGKEFRQMIIESIAATGGMGH
ncbi:hypothetical protein KQH40_00675 [bacterium]|nr:hypothetical protein [bacterium]